MSSEKREPKEGEIFNCLISTRPNFYKHIKVISADYFAQEIKKLQSEVERIQTFSREEGARLFDCQADRDAYKMMCDELAGALELCHRRMKHTAWVEDECFIKATETLEKHNKMKEKLDGIFIQ